MEPCTYVKPPETREKDDKESAKEKIEAERNHKPGQAAIKNDVRSGPSSMSWFDGINILQIFLCYPDLDRAHVP